MIGQRLKKITAVFLASAILAVIPINQDASPLQYAETEAAVRSETVKTETEGLTVKASYQVIDREATVTVETESDSPIVSLKYLKGDYTNPDIKRWKKKGKSFTKKGYFRVDEAGVYSILAEDADGHKAVCRVKVTLEFKAVWIAYYDFGETKGKSKEYFTEYVGKMFDKVAAQGMNAVVVHVRPFSDAMYKSKYYPWSVYASGKQGVNPGYDPLEIMVKEAHKRNLEIHAWLNPYRITSSGTDVKVLAEDNPARVWLTDGKADNDRNVLAFSGKLYYNPSSKDVQKLIVNGIKEIVQNYDVDGIHFDDYFYPEYLGSDYKNVFDGKEYDAYLAKCESKGKTAMDIVEWRRNNVNTLVKSIYSAVKEIDETVEFGISPGGYIDHLLKVDRNYVDFPTWLANDGYIDYICPQLYWTFDNVSNTFPYDSTLRRWIDYRTANVNVYAGVAVYKCTGANNGDSSIDANFAEEYILAEMIEAGRETGKVDGYIMFDYADFVSGVNQKQIAHMKDEFEGKLQWDERGYPIIPEPEPAAPVEVNPDAEATLDNVAADVDKDMCGIR